MSTAESNIKRAKQSELLHKMTDVSFCINWAVLYTAKDSQKREIDLNFKRKPDKLLDINLNRKSLVELELIYKKYSVSNTNQISQNHWRNTSAWPKNILQWNSNTQNYVYGSHHWWKTRSLTAFLQSRTQQNSLQPRL